MKFGKDPRTTRVNGQVSPSRQYVIEALEAMGKGGATTDELVTLIGENMPGGNPKQSIGKTLGGLERDQYVVRYRGRWYETECAPTEPTNNNGSHSAPPKTEYPKVQIAQYAGKRSGKTVSVYTSPKVLDDAIGLALLIKNEWYKIPLFASLRLCMGTEAPMWSPEQEMYRNVTVIRITHKGGKVTEERPSPADVITIAPEE